MGEWGDRRVGGGGGAQTEFCVYTTIAIGNNQVHKHTSYSVHVKGV